MKLIPSPVKPTLIIYGLCIAILLCFLLPCLASSDTYYTIKSDDFEWGAVGEELSNSGGEIDWTTSASGYSYVKISAVCSEGIRSAAMFRDGSNNVLSRFDMNASEPEIKISFIVQKSDTNATYFLHGNGVKRIQLQVNTDENIWWHDDSGAHDTGKYIGLTWFVLSISNINWNSGTYDIYVDGEIIKESAEMITSSSSNNKIELYSSAGTSSFYIDDLKVLNEGWDVGGDSSLPIWFIAILIVITLVGAYTGDPLVLVAGLTGSTVGVFWLMSFDLTGPSVWLLICLLLCVGCFCLLEILRKGSFEHVEEN